MWTCHNTATNCLIGWRRDKRPGFVLDAISEPLQWLLHFNNLHTWNYRLVVELWDWNSTVFIVYTFNVFQRQGYKKSWHPYRKLATSCLFITADRHLWTSTPAGWVTKLFHHRVTITHSRLRNVCSNLGQGRKGASAYVNPNHTTLVCVCLCVCVSVCVCVRVCFYVRQSVRSLLMCQLVAVSTPSQNPPLHAN